MEYAYLGVKSKEDADEQWRHRIEQGQTSGDIGGLEVWRTDAISPKLVTSIHPGRRLALGPEPLHVYATCHSTLAD